MVTIHQAGTAGKRGDIQGFLILAGHAASSFPYTIPMFAPSVHLGKRTPGSFCYPEYHIQRAGAVFRAPFPPFSDIGKSCTPEQGDSRIADSSQDLRLAAIPHSTAVFVKGQISDMMQLVFDCPVSSGVQKQLFRSLVTCVPFLYAQQPFALSQHISRYNMQPGDATPDIHLFCCRSMFFHLWRFAANYARR